MIDNDTTWNLFKGKIMGEKSWELSEGAVIEQLSKPLDERPRVYAYLTKGEQIVRLPSVAMFEKYRDDIAGAWVSGTTIADLISKR